MQFISISDAKTHLSQYIESIVANHETIIICKNGKPIAQLTEYYQPREKKLGLLKGKIKISPDFDELPDDFMAHFEDRS
ncbi:MAG: type II toxin-antitoxin system prevent-host-death family antitoxin [Gammaproteobacteria bacterium]|nr:type II toxin-antitoxin system prevent-host-death family antitoxin [Gammaproteobacteria bacterium]